MKLARTLGQPLLPLAFSLLSAGALAQEPIADLEARLARLVEQLEGQRETSHVAGMALAVVHGDELVLSHGFGFADLAGERPVEPETIFAAGSTTKAFTAAAWAFLIDQGEASWDDPVTRYLPYFDPAVRSDDPEDHVNLRDLLSHRSGFGRMGMLWGGGDDMPGERILRTAVNAEPRGEFRQEFHYSNMMYLAAGLAAGAAGESSWEELVQQRILDPLGMTSSSLSIDGLEEDERLAVGYAWDDEKGEFETKTMLNLDRIGPAGSLNSNVLDMAQWVRFQLARGEFAGERLLSEERFDEMWTSQIAVPPSMNYGLGWFLQDRDGVRVVEHGGNIDGFSAQVTLLPDHDLGYVLLCNVSATSLQQGSIGVFLDAMLGELAAADEDSAGGDPGEFDEYLGKYIANFSQFQDATFEVLVQNGRLAVDVPGQTVFELKAPDEDGRWVFALTDQIAVSFERDEADQVVGMKMYQAGMTYDIPREGHADDEEVDEALLDEKYGQYFGEYLANFGPFQDAVFEVRTKGEQLAIDIPGQMLYALEEPDDEGLWYFSVTDEIAIAFVRDGEDAPVRALELHQAGQVFEVPRQEIEPDLPSAKDLHELLECEARGKTWRAQGGIVVRGSIWIPSCGLEGRFTQWIGGPRRFATQMDFGDFGCMLSGVSGDYGASYSAMRGLDVLEGRGLDQVTFGDPWILGGDWRDLFDDEKVVGQGTVDERDCWKVLAQRGDSEATFLVDAESGHVRRVTTTVHESGMQIPITTNFSDYSEADQDLRIPGTTVISNPFMGDLTIQVIEIDTAVEIDEELFRIEEGETRLDGTAD